MDKEIGYPLEYVEGKEEELEKSGLCSICHCLFREPVHADNAPHDKSEEEPCGHIFCQTCIRKWLDTDSRCPSCKKALTKTQLRPDMDLRRKIRSLVAKCHFDSKMCEAKGPIGKDGFWWQEHDKVCGFKPVSCPSCKNQFQRKSLRDHFQNCPSVPAPCPFQCGFLVCRKDFKEHEGTCAYRQVECPKCGQGKIRSGKLQAHLDKECKDFPCAYHFLGCPAYFSFKDTEAQQEHMSKELIFHMSLLMRDVQSLRLKLGEQAPLQTDSLQEPEELTFLWSLPWEPPAAVVKSNALAEAYGGEWGFTYGHPSSEDNALPIAVHCRQRAPLISSIKLNIKLALLHPATGETLKEVNGTHGFADASATWGTSWELSILESLGAFDRNLGLIHLLFRARLKRA